MHTASQSNDQTIVDFLKIKFKYDRANFYATQEND